MAQSLNVDAPVWSKAIRAKSSPTGGQRWQYYLAGVGVLLTVWGAWTVIAWLLKGPYEVTAFRDTTSTSWAAARVYEGVFILAGMALALQVVRGCIRSRRMTFDAQLCLAGLLTLWTDPLANFFQPVWTYSSHWTNVVNWCSQTPFVVNPECGRMVEPLIFAGVIFTFGLYGAALLGGWLTRMLQQRFPGISRARLLVAIGLFGIAFDMLLEVPLLSLKLLSYLGFPSSLTLFGDSIRYPVPVMLGMGLFFSSLVACRNFKDDRGRTVFERGLEHLPGRQRSVIAFFSLIGFLMLSVNLLNLLVAVPSGPYADPKPDLPAHLVNGMCDRSGFEATRYGPCPGTQGYKAPVRFLPGPNPPDGWRVGVNDLEGDSR